MSTSLTIFDGNDHDAKEAEILAAFDEIPFGNSAYQTLNIVMKKEGPERAYRQALIEMRERYITLKKAQFTMQKNELKKEELETAIQNSKGNDRRRHEIDLADLMLDIRMSETLIKDAIIELRIYQKCYEELKKKLGGNITRDQFEESEKGYWHRRAIKQAERDMIATGTIGLGNVELLEQAGIDPYAAREELRRHAQEKQLEIAEGEATADISFLTEGNGN
jgi:hypothetical protein